MTVTGECDKRQVRWIADAPLLDLTSPATARQYHFAFGLRGDSGAMAVSRFGAGSGG